MSSSIILFAILSPLFMVIMLLLKYSGEGEIFYKQKRIGKGLTHFWMLKFATMLKNSPNMNLGTTTIVNDPRVTFIGKYLRYTKLNELPQILNVIKGDLSVVGPRPLPENEFNHYTEEVREIISKVKPGITGIGSLVFRDEEGIIQLNGPKEPKDYYTNVILPYKGLLEVWYKENISFKTDIIILFLTFWSLIFKNNSTLIYRIFDALPEKPNDLILKK